MTTEPHALIARWQATSVEVLAPATQRRYEGVLRGFLTWFEQSERRTLALADLHPITLVGYRGWLQRHATPSTVNTHLCALRTWCAWLTEEGHLDHNPAARLKLVGLQQPLTPSALTPAQVNALLRQAQRTRYPARNTAILQMLIQTGMRIGECAALDCRDIALSERKGAVRIRAGKGNKSRSVPLNDSVRLALALYLAPRLEVAPTLSEVADTWPTSGANLGALWRSERKRPLSVREMSRMIQALIRDCTTREAVPRDATPHSLRHTFATRYLLRHPGDLVGLARLLGHASIQTTRIYVQPTEADMAERISQIDLNAYAG